MRKTELKFIVCVMIYILGSFLLYYTGPLVYNYTNNNQVIFFFIIYNLVFIIGYYLGINNTRIVNRNYSFRIISIKTKKTILLIGTVISFSLGIINLISYFGTLNPIVIYNMFLAGIGDATELYQQTLEASLYSSGGILTQLTTLTSPITYLIVPIGILLYSKLSSKTFKYFWILTILINLIANIMTGTNIGVFRLVISAFSAIYILIEKNQFNLYKKSKKSTKIFGALLIIFFIFIFLNNVVSRMPEIGTFFGNVYVNYDNWLIQIMPQSFKTGLILVLSYLTQGYYGFSLLFNYKWLPTFPVGNSNFLMNYTYIFGYQYNSVFQRTYINRMASEWSPTINWHTAYTWFANDVSPMGVIFVMFIFGIMIGIFYKEALNSNHTAVLLFSLLLIFVVFIPMNNTMLSNPLTFIPFVSFLFAFFIRYKTVFIIRR